MHNLRDAHGPLADGGEARLVPVAVGDDVERDRNAQLAGHLQRLEIIAGNDALAVELYTLSFRMEELAGRTIAVKRPQG